MRPSIDNLSTDNRMNHRSISTASISRLAFLPACSFGCAQQPGQQQMKQQNNPWMAQNNRNSNRIRIKPHRPVQPMNSNGPRCPDHAERGREGQLAESQGH